MCVNSRNQVFTHGEADGIGSLTCYDRKKGTRVKEMKCQCDHERSFTSNICEHPLDPEVVTETCPSCRKIRSYNVITGETKDIYNEAALVAICTGPIGTGTTQFSTSRSGSSPPGTGTLGTSPPDTSSLGTNLSFTILGLDDKGHILQLRWKNESEGLVTANIIRTKLYVTDVRYMCYVEHHIIVVLSCCYPGRICAVKLGDGSTLWEFNQQIDGEDMDPYGLCHDTDGRIYVATLDHGILTIDGWNGKLLQQLLKDLNICSDISWQNVQPQLTVLADDHMHTFNVSRLQHTQQ